jgi:hypothetical protein
VCCALSVSFVVQKMECMKARQREGRLKIDVWLLNWHNTSRKVCVSLARADS